jgi:pimeloyl-ACP methyl ester carboxylesterase
MTADRRQIYLQTPAPDGSAWYSSVWLSVPEQARRRELQVLVHGAGYDHRYWDWPQKPNTYSYVDWATKRGISTLTVDRVGCGLSSHPPGAKNTIAAQASVLTRIVESARKGLPGAEPFERIVLIGHSLGSVICGIEAATYADCNAIILTGYLPSDPRGEIEGTFILDAFVPALEASPHLTGLIDDDYICARPETRVPLMYRLENADPEVVKLDEQMRGTSTRGELLGAWDAGVQIRDATAPALVVVGEYDVLVYDAVQDDDVSPAIDHLKSAAPSNFEFHVVGGTGHNLNLHRNAQATYEVMGEWLDRTRSP